MNSDEREARGVVDRYMDEVLAEAGCADLVLAGFGAAQDPPTPAWWSPGEFLDVDVDEFAGPVTNVTDRQGGRAIEISEA